MTMRAKQAAPLGHLQMSTDGRGWWALRTDPGGVRIASGDVTPQLAADLRACADMIDTALTIERTPDDD